MGESTNISLNYLSYVWISFTKSIMYLWKSDSYYHDSFINKSII